MEKSRKGDESENAAAPEARRLAAVIEERIVRTVCQMLQGSSLMLMRYERKIDSGGVG